MGNRFLQIMRVAALALSGFALLGLAGCDLLEPGDTTPNENQAPDTEITSGPRANATNSYAVRIAWKGLDYDGLVVAYELKVDGGSAVRVTRADSSFLFTAANKDEQHSVSVAAIDNVGAIDPTPATLIFTATNTPPNTKLSIQGDPAPGATFGRGGVFTIVAADDPDNGPDYTYRFKIDDGGQWSEWLNTSEIEFGTTSRFGLLPEGSHKFIAQVRDAALAVDETPVEFLFNSSNAVKPVASVTALVNNQNFYEDKSAFSLPSGNTVAFTWSVAFNYAGAKSGGSRYRIDGGAWTEYSTAASALSLSNVAAGAHSLEVEYRDIGGALSDVVKFDYEIVAATLNQGILVVDDRNGGRATDTNVDNFYAQILAGAGAAKVTQWDVVTSGNLTPKKGIGNYSLVIWESDEDFFRSLPDQTQLVTEYLALNGKLWLSGWRTLQNISKSNSFSNNYTPNFPTRPANADFVYNVLKIATSNQTSQAAFDMSGATGEAGYPAINVDRPKTFPANRAGISPVEVMTLREGASPIYNYASVTSNPDFQGKPVGMKYLGTDYKLVVLGFPFYTIKTDEATEAAKTILKDLGEL